MRRTFSWILLCLHLASPAAGAQWDGKSYQVSTVQDYSLDEMDKFICARGLNKRYTPEGFVCVTADDLAQRDESCMAGTLKLGYAKARLICDLVAAEMDNQ